MKRAWDVFAGAGLLLALNIFVIDAAQMAEADEPIRVFSAVLAIAIGAVQLVYALPLAWLWRKRRERLVGLAAAAVGTAVVNVLGLLN